MYKGRLSDLQRMNVGNLGAAPQHHVTIVDDQIP